ncbi:MAG: hypothetical protein V7L25_15095 [Nostoc sp.]|uniref:hypothetical protein n=1 Tax=Nostoc sp. TaxID=1180 RepID=UPI002FF2537B
MLTILNKIFIKPVLLFDTIVTVVFVGIQKLGVLEPLEHPFKIRVHLVSVQVFKNWLFKIYHRDTESQK